MRQTRGALTMLLQQYRGILKNAWIKNFVAAAVVVASGSAMAADLQVINAWDDTGYKTYNDTLTSGETVDISSEKEVFVHSVGNTVNVVDGGALNITGSTKASIFANEINIKGGEVNFSNSQEGRLITSALNVTGGKITVAEGKIARFKGLPEYNGTPSAEIDTETFGSQSIVVSGGTIVNSGFLQVGSINDTHPDATKSLKVTGGEVVNNENATLNLNMNSSFARGTLNNEGVLDVGSSEAKDVPNNYTVTGYAEDLGLKYDEDSYGGQVKIENGATLSLADDSVDLREDIFTTLASTKTRHLINNGTLIARTLNVLDTGNLEALASDSDEQATLQNAGTIIADSITTNADFRVGQGSNVTALNGITLEGSGDGLLDVTGTLTVGKNGGSATLKNVKTLEACNDANSTINLLGSVNLNGADVQVNPNSTAVINIGNADAKSSVSGINVLDVMTGAEDNNNSGTIKLKNATVSANYLGVMHEDGMNATTNSQSVSVDDTHGLVLDGSDLSVAQSYTLQYANSVKLANGSNLSLNVANISTTDDQTINNDSDMTSEQEQAVWLTWLNNGAGTTTAVNADSSSTVTVTGNTAEIDIGTDEGKKSLYSIYSLLGIGDTSGLSSSFKGTVNGLNIKDSSVKTDTDSDGNKTASIDEIINSEAAATTDAFADTAVTGISSAAIEKSINVGSLAASSEAELSQIALGAATVTLNKAAVRTIDGQKVNAFATASDGSIAGVELSKADSELILNNDGAIGAITTTEDNQGNLRLQHGTIAVQGDVGSKERSLAQVVVKKSTANVANVYTEALDVCADSNLVATVIAIGDEASSVAGQVNADSLQLSSGTSLSVGLDGDNGASGTVVAKRMQLNGGNIFVDPEYGQKASAVVADSFGEISETEDINTTLDGSVTIAKNAVVGVGVGLDDLRSALTSLGLTDATGSFGESNTANALYLNKGLTVASGNNVTLNKNATVASTDADKFVLGANSALVISSDLASAIANDTTAAVTLANGGSGAVTAAEGSKVVIAGEVTGADVNNKKIFATNVDGIEDLVNNEGAQVSFANNSYYQSSLNADGTLSVSARADLASSMTKASAPVRSLITDVVNTATNIESSGKEGVRFVYDRADASLGGDVETAARLAVLGGAYQVAQKVASASQSAALGRAGFGVDTPTAVKGQHVDVWTDIIYSHSSSDNFKAQGIDYGAKVKLYGLALGADHLFDNGIRSGAYINFGKGTADGKGAGAGVDNDFDFFGAGLYAGGKIWNELKLFADLGVSQIKNDLERDVAGYGTLKSSPDMTVMSLGLTAQYVFSTDFAEIAPYAGVRLSRYDLDSYDVKSSQGKIARSDFDVQNVVSFPVGVTLSKEFISGSWKFNTLLDAGVIFNTGDLEADGNTRFTGASNGMKLSSDVLDDVSYHVGVNFDVAVENASFGLGVKYSGSDNTDDYAVNAHVSYAF